MLRCAARRRNPARFGEREEETFLEGAGEKGKKVENVLGFGFGRGFVREGIWRVWGGGKLRKLGRSNGEIWI